MQETFVGKIAAIVFGAALVVFFVVENAALRFGDAGRQIVGHVGFGQHVLLGDLAILPQGKQRIIQQDHAHLGPGLDGGRDAKGLVLANQVADGRRHDQHFVSRAAATADLGQQRLRQHADDRRRQLRADLFLLTRGEHVDDAVDRPLRAGGVQRAEHDVPGLGGRDRRFDRLQVAQLTDQDHVWILSQGASQGFGKAGYIDADFPLIDRRFLVRMVKLDRVFDRDDMVVDRLVDVVDHAGQRGAFARSGGTGDQEQTACGRMISFSAGRQDA